MALLHRTLITWLLTLIFCSLIAYKIDYSVEWNWFFVFIPSFLHSFILILYVVFKMIQLMKSNHERQGDPGMKRRWWHLTVALLMMTFQIVLCLRLQTGLPRLYYVFIPFWFVLVVFCADVLITLVVNTASSSSTRSRSRS